MKPKSKSGCVVYPVLFLLVVWLAVVIAPCFEAEGSIFSKINALPDYLQQPFNLAWLPATPQYILGLSLVYWLAVLYAWSNKRHTRNGEEHGSAQWGNVSELNKKYAEKELADNIILTENFRIGLDIYKHQHNINTIVVGGSGAGKTRFYAKPNILQANTSFIITDPKGELLKSTGGFLQKQGYEVRVFDLIHPETSMCYNPFAYITKDDDVLSLITNLIRNTTPKNAVQSDTFWEKGETSLLQALMLYLWHEAPESEQNFVTILEMLAVMAAEEDFPSINPVDYQFSELRKRDPSHIALKLYDIFKTAPAKTANSIVISAGVRLSCYGLPGIARMTSRDEMDFVSIGRKKVALFCVMPDIDKSFNFLISMLYTQAFQQLERLADEQGSGRLPVHVHCLMDEFANIPLPDMFENVLSTARSREINISIMLQNISQLKALFDKQWESIIGNCDQFLYLGGNEQSTHEYVSKLIGKETIDTNTYGQQRGRSGHYTTNYQRTGRDLLTPDEVRRIPRKNAILFISGERAVFDKKYNLQKHPAVKLTSDGAGKSFVYSNSLARMYSNGLRPEDYEILDPDEDFPSIEPEEAPAPPILQKAAHAKKS